MKTDKKQIKTIELNIPLREEYISIIRLTTSGIAGEIGFDIDEIDDIKVSVSEVCINIIKDMKENHKDINMHIKYEFNRDKLEIELKSDDYEQKDSEKRDMNRMKISKLIISSLMDETSFIRENGVKYKMIKYKRDEHNGEIKI